MPFKMRSIQNGDSNDSTDIDRGTGAPGGLSLAPVNSYEDEDISSDSEGSFDAAEFEAVYGPPAGVMCSDATEAVQMADVSESWGGRAEGFGR